MDPPPTVFSHSFDLLIPLKQPVKENKQSYCILQLHVISNEVSDEKV